MVGIDEVQPPPETSATKPVSLLVTQKLSQFEPSQPISDGFVSWCPALQNWNPWKSLNIDEAPLAFVCSFWIVFGEIFFIVQFILM